MISIYIYSTELIDILENHEDFRWPQISRETGMSANGGDFLFHVGNVQE